MAGEAAGKPPAQQAGAGAARSEGLRELLADWAPEQYAELGELLTRLSRAVLGEHADRHLIDSGSSATSPTDRS